MNITNLRIFMLP